MDTVLHHCLEKLLPLKSHTPNISYWFVDQFVHNYIQLQNSFENNGNVCLQPQEDTQIRDDIKFCSSYSFYKTHMPFPKIKFFSLPNQSVKASLRLYIKVG